MVNSSILQTLFFCGGIVLGVLLAFACQAVYICCKRKPVHDSLLKEATPVPSLRIKFMKFLSPLLSDRTGSNVSELPNDTPRFTASLDSSQKMDSAHTSYSEHYIEPLHTRPQESLPFLTQMIKSEDSSIGSIIQYINTVLSDIIVDNLTSDERKSLLTIISQRFKMTEKERIAFLNMTGSTQDRTLVPEPDDVVQLFGSSKAFLGHT